MCGIAGFFRISDKPFPNWKTQHRVLDALRNRGPDGCGMWRDSCNRVVLLHRRLSIQDLSETGAQPMHSADGSLTIVFNGEIYNVAELRAWVSNYPFKGTSDTEIILALYERFGTKVLEFLRGMFAFVIWDSRKQALFLARDVYGIKPLYIAETPDGIWFSSQVKSLLQVPQVDRSAEPAGQTGFFLWGSIPEPYTLYKGIRSLRSGYSLWLQKGCEPKYNQYASIAKALTGDDFALPEESDSMRMKKALYDSIKAHFVSDVPVAIYLSAGLDSSTILGIAASSSFPGDLDALTMAFDAHRGTVNDETAEAIRIAEHYGVPQQVKLIMQSDFEGELPHFLHAMDQPSIDGINTYFIAKMTKDVGFKVSLSGLGGDELFGGYGSFRQVPRITNLVSGLHVSRKFGGNIRRYTERLFRKITSPKYAGVLEYGGTIEGAYLLRRGLFMPWELPEVLDPDLAAAGLEELDSSYFDDKELDELKGFSQHVQICFLESTKYMRNQLLRDADWAGMAHSIEIRTPFVDQFLLKQIAPLLRANPAPTKLAMAKTPGKALPPAVLQRKKTGFAVPMREWLTASSSVKPERGLRSWAKFVYRTQWLATSSNP